VEDVHEGDLWLFPGGIPHSIQGLGEDGCKFLLVFKDGNFNEFGTFLLTEWLHHTPKEVLAKNFDVPESTFDKVPKRELFIFQRELPRPLAEEKRQAEAVTGMVPEQNTGGGTSDARFIARYCPVAEFGLVGASMHRVDECVPVAELRQLTQVYKALIEGFCV